MLTAFGIYVGMRLKAVWRLLIPALIVVSHSAVLTCQVLPPEPAENQRTVGNGMRRASDPGKQPFVRTFFHEQWRMWSSPFRPGNYDSHAVKKYVIPFAVISTALIATDRRVTDALPNTDDQTTWSKRVSQIGAPYSLAGMAGTMYLLSKAKNDTHARETGWLGMEAIAHSQIIVHGMKYISRRERPDKTDSRGGFFEGGDSFPSGHAASSFALATVFAYEYRDHIAVPIVAYTLATGVSAARMGARRHWVSDAFVGGSIGFLIGRYVYRTHHDPNLPGSPVKRTSRIIPQIGFGERGLAILWRM